MDHLARDRSAKKWQDSLANSVKRYLATRCQDYPETRSNVTMANVQSGPSAYQMHTECGRESAHTPTVSGNGRVVHSYRVKKFSCPIYFPIIISWSRSKCNPFPTLIRLECIYFFYIKKWNLCIINII